MVINIYSGKNFVFNLKYYIKLIEKHIFSKYLFIKFQYFLNNQELAVKISRLI